MQNITHCSLLGLLLTQTLQKELCPEKKIRHSKDANTDNYVGNTAADGNFNHILYRFQCQITARLAQLFHMHYFGSRNYSQAGYSCFVIIKKKSSVI
jgi:hypothetical protein